MIVTGADVQSPAIIRLVLELERRVVVTIVEGRITSESELVFSEITENPKCVLIIEMMGDTEVGIRETGLASAIFAFLWQQAEQPVGICDPCPGDDRGLALGYRPLQMEAAGQDADPGRAFPLLIVTVFRPDIQHG